MDELKAEIAQVCARLIAQEGLAYGPAKQRALREMGLPGRSALPSNDQIEDALVEYLALFYGDSQPAELRALRELALVWMRRLDAFSPQLGGAVWRGTATRLSDIHLQLYVDDPKLVELALIDQGLRYEVQIARDAQGRPYDVLSIQVLCAPLQEYVGLHLSVRDYRGQHGSLVPDARGRTAQGGLAALQKLLEMESHE
ncbi:MAG: hypothetical protein E6Q78_05520 [Rhodoferax sp.]|nr:MAG: hypothetical protein E6Q78_05520 [Rhodoferax sp.]